MLSDHSDNGNPGLFYPYDPFNYGKKIQQHFSENSDLLFANIPKV